MPTEYTADIANEEKEISMSEFLLGCARNFGACLSLRDESSDMEIPVFEPSDYHAKKIKEAQEELSTYEVMPESEACIHADCEYSNALKKLKDDKVKNLERRCRYNKMIREVNAWKPPSSEHVSLKKFALDQLNTSLDFDCYPADGENEYLLSLVKKLEGASVEEWLEEQKARCLKDISYHAEKFQEEIVRVGKNNKWVRQLRESLESL